MTTAKSGTEGLISFILFAITAICGIAFTKEMGEYVIVGMQLAVISVIPSSFPFMIISDFYTHYGRPEKMRHFSSAFRRLSGLPESALGTFICGNIGGFPIGAKMASELYRVGGIDKDNAERLAALSSNPSCAFVFGAVGLGMYGNYRIASLLLASVYISTFICVLVTKTKHRKNRLPNENFKQSYNFVKSVRNAGTSSVSLIAFISCFSVLVGMIKNHIKSTYISSAIIMIVEVTNAAKTFSQSSVFSSLWSLILTSFSLGFGGLSIMMQSAIFTEEAGLSMKKFVCIKLLEGMLSAAITAIGYFVFLT